MEKGSYSWISGKKTLALVVALITLIIILSIYSVFLIFRKSSVLTNSSSFERPTPTALPSPAPLTIPTSVQRFGD